jgi:NAD(P)-dependent dehydrogenase (short-subunit alcohol dehydrogenase family)
VLRLSAYTNLTLLVQSNCNTTAAVDLAPSSIRVNAVNPGVIQTPLQQRGGLDDAAYAAFLERSKTTHPLGRVGQPDEVANLVTFLYVVQRRVTPFRVASLRSATPCDVRVHKAHYS